jgi:hypothetical protein
MTVGVIAEHNKELERADGVFFEKGITHRYLSGIKPRGKLSGGPRVPYYPNAKGLVPSKG